MLLRQKHIEYIKSLDKKKNELAYWLSAHLRLSGVYWGLAALELMNAGENLDRDEVIKFVLECESPSGGFGAHPGHDPHLLYTLSALQILAMKDALDKVDRKKTTDFVMGLRQDDGSFMGDKYGEIDSRFVYTAVQSLWLLGELDKLDPNTAEWLAACQNFDGGFGLVPGAESHAAQAFTVVGALAILERLDAIRTEDAAWWLSERQTPSGGLNGRPEKLPDVCYSWWVLSSLAILGHVDWIDKEKLRQFIYRAQDEETGGIADREGDEPDVFHTVFGIAGLSLLGFDDLEPVDPTFCLPRALTTKLGRRTQ